MKISEKKEEKFVESFNLFKNQVIGKKILGQDPNLDTHQTKMDPRFAFNKS